MLARAIVALALLGLSVSAASAQPKIEQAPIKQTSAADAAAMFTNYCSPCHGKTGVGNGPAAAALSKAPADLTKISARNNGTFPEVRVKRYIEGADEVAAHGSRDMPMWGDLFRSLNRDTAQIRIQALADYLRKLQQ